MEIIPLSNPYQRKDIPSEALPVPTDPARQRSSDITLSDRTSEQAPASLRDRRKTDSVDISSSSGEGQGQQNRQSAPSSFLNFEMPRIKQWDHKLLAWFMTAVTLQGSMPQNRGMNVDLMV